MKHLIYLGIIALLASCSSSKYTAHFQKSNGDYGYGELAAHAPGTTSPLTSSENHFVASTSKEQGIIVEAASPNQAAAMADIKSAYSKMSRSEKKAFRKELRKEIKNIEAAKSNGKVYTPVEMEGKLDHDLKLAAIFGSIGVVALLIAGNVFNIIGGIALIIGVVFFVMWLVRQ